MGAVFVRPYLLTTREVPEEDREAFARRVLTGDVPAASVCRQRGRLQQDDLGGAVVALEVTVG